MPLILSDLIALVRSETGNTDDTQYSDDEVGTWMWIEYGKVRRTLSAKFPELFETTSSNVVVTTASPLINKPSDFEKLVRIEQLIGSDWQTVPHANKVNPHLDSYVGYREQGATLQLTPGASAAGTYRVVYVRNPSETFPADDIPRGAEDAIIQKVIAKAQIRVGGDPAPHYEEAKNTLKDFIKDYRAGRRSNAPEPGFVSGYSPAAVNTDD
jgi:hypothetical protein